MLSREEGENADRLAHTLSPAPSRSGHVMRHHEGSYPAVTQEGAPSFPRLSLSSAWRMRTSCYAVGPPGRSGGVKSFTPKPPPRLSPKACSSVCGPQAVMSTSYPPR